MPQPDLILSLIDHAVRAIGEALHRPGVDPEATERLKQVLPRAALIFEDVVDKPTLKQTQLLELAEVLETLGQCAFEMKATNAAYNLYELSSTCGAMIGRPALKVALMLRELADADNPDQLGLAAWRYATEKLRDSVTRQTDWLATIDAVETALTLWVSDPQGQAQLFEELKVVLKQVADTPIAELLFIVPVQAPPNAMAPETRLRLGISLLGVSPPPQLQSKQAIAATMSMAAVEAQRRVDDLRLRLAGPVPDVPASMTWHDVTLEHRGLISAVPLGRALLADPKRTGVLALELVHEITHAYCLVGPIGWAHRAYRAGITYLEMLMADRSQPNPWPNALSTLPDGMGLCAHRQLATLLRSEMLIAAWTPWLEGVALYVELLCDPADDPNEITLPFKAVRHLVDYPVPGRGASESEEQFAQRLGDTIAKEFESFYSPVCRRKSRLRHLAYMGHDAERPSLRSDRTRAVYLWGYLLIRSVVARWERTLDHRLEPTRAAKLLLDAVRDGSMSAIPPLDTPIEEFLDACYERMNTWTRQIAELDRESLSVFLQPVERHERGPRYSWKTGKPVPVASDSNAEAEEFAKEYETLRDSAARWIFGEAQPETSDHHNAYCEVFEAQNRLATVLPVGRDHARLLLSEDDRATVCPRTYAGIIRPDDHDSKQLADPRYSVHWFRLGSAEEAGELRRICGSMHTSRVLVTRVIDLTGNAHMPAGFSYVYLGLEWQWNRITVGYTGSQLDDDWGAFKGLIETRVNAAGLVGDEATTLASLSFLADRFEKIAPEAGIVHMARKFDRAFYASEVGLRACAAAFAIDTAVLEQRLADATPLQLNDLVNALHKTGWNQTVRIVDGDATLADIVFATGSHSGVVPYGAPT